FRSFGHEFFERHLRHAKLLRCIVWPIDPEAASLNVHRADTQRTQRLVPAIGEQIDIRITAQVEHLRRVVRMKRIPIAEDALKDVELDRFHSERGHYTDRARCRTGYVAWASRPCACGLSRFRCSRSRDNARARRP